MASFGTSKVAFWICKHYYAVGGNPDSEHWRWIPVFEGQEEKWKDYRLPSWIFLA